MRRALGRALVPITVGLAVGAAFAQDFDDVQIEVVSVAPGIHMLTGRGGNIGVSSGPDGVFLIDDQFAPLTDKVRAAVAGLGQGPIRFVVNTHWHGDHTGGNENLGKGGTLIVAHENVRRRMSSEQFIAGLDRRVPASPEAALPVVTFTEAVTFHLNGDEIHVFHPDPAHTDGDSIVYFRKSNVIHAGDTYFNGFYPFVDLSSGGSFEGMLAAAEVLLALSDEKTRIIPGHGPLSERAELSAYRDMLVAVRDRVKAALERGESLEQMLAARPTRDLDAQWGGGFLGVERFLRIVYASLAQP